MKQSNSEIRQDLISKRWVIYRNFDIPLDQRFLFRSVEWEGKTTDDSSLSEHHRCSYCPGNENETPLEIMAFRHRNHMANDSSWWVRVIPDPDSLLGIGEGPERTAVGIFDRLSGFGHHEMVIETPVHGVDAFFEKDFTIREALFAYQHRIGRLKMDDRIKYVSFTRFQGREAGQRVAHSYGHILATPVISKRINQELNNARDHYSVKERCIFCDMLSQELEMKERIVVENEHFCVISPYASRIPFEMVLLPKKHNAFFEKEPPDRIHSLASIVNQTVGTYRKVLQNPPYVFSLHNGPNSMCRKLEDYWQTLPSDFHWHCEIIPILKTVAAFEFGTGIYMNVVKPEEATAVLRSGMSLRGKNEE